MEKKTLRKTTGSASRSGFTLVELVVVVTILAILAVIGFLALSGYVSDSKKASSQANVRSLQSAISMESSITGNSPRYYVVHDSAYALSGSFVYVENTQYALTGGQYGLSPVDSNYSAGKPDYVKLKVNPEKFRISKTGARSFFELASAEFDDYLPAIGAVDLNFRTSAGKISATSWFQVAGILRDSGTVVIAGDFPTTMSGSTAGLIRDPNSTSSTGTLTDASSSVSMGAPSSDGVVFHLKGEGTNASTGIVDSSSLGATTSNQSVASIFNVSTSKYRIGNGSISYNNYWGGVSWGASFAEFPSKPEYSFGTADFTIEYYFRNDGYGCYGVPHITRSASNQSNHNWYVGTNKFGVPLINVYQANGTTVAKTLSAISQVPSGTWGHVALARQNGTLRMFVNGKLEASTSFTGSMENWSSSGSVILGNSAGGGNGCSSTQGNLDELKITRNIANYTQDFIPEKPAGTTVLLVHGEGAANSAVISDASENAATAATQSAASIYKISAVSKIGTGSIYSNNYWGDPSWGAGFSQFSNKSAYSFGTSDFAIEYWFKNSGYGCYGVPHVSRSSPDQATYDWSLGTSNTGVPKFTLYQATGTAVDKTVSATTAVPANTWAHVAVTRKSGTVRIFVNGKEEGSLVIASTTEPWSANASVVLGNAAGGGNGCASNEGWIDELRIRNGDAVYASDFIPSAVPFESR